MQSKRTIIVVAFFDTYRIKKGQFFLPLYDSTITIITFIVCLYDATTTFLWKFTLVRHRIGRGRVDSWVVIVAAIREDI